MLLSPKRSLPGWWDTSCYKARAAALRKAAEPLQSLTSGSIAQEAVEGFKRYCYQDDMESRTDVQGTLALLHVAHFFGAPRLAGLCDLAMSRNFKHASPKDEGTSSPELLLMYDEAGPAAVHMQGPPSTSLTKPCMPAKLVQDAMTWW